MSLSRLLAGRKLETKCGSTLNIIIKLIMSSCLVKVESYDNNKPLGLQLMGQNPTNLNSGVNPGGWGGPRPPRFWAGVVGERSGVVGRSWTGFGKHYSVFCTESMLENVVFYKKHLLMSVIFMRKRENAGVKRNIS